MKIPKPSGQPPKVTKVSMLTKPDFMTILRLHRAQIMNSFTLPENITMVIGGDSPGVNREIAEAAMQSFKARCEDIARTEINRIMEAAKIRIRRFYDNIENQDCGGR